ncbi:MAG: Gfo/Idh/MocA family oxidoreductase [Pirellulales bacterium]|nr:Gfo/Idh/MocA family oxidoreductase [Pirellulales bacterium]
MPGIAVIGCGRWGANYVRVFHEIAGARVVAVVDRDAATLARMAQRYPGVWATAEIEPVLANPQVDAVVIATEAASHFRLSTSALEHGKHLLVEKPLTLVSDESRRLAELAASKNRVLMVGHTYLYNDAVRKIRELIQQPATGKLYYLESRRHHLGYIRDDVGAMWDLAAHDVAIFSYLLGEEPEAVSVVGRKYLRDHLEDVAFMHFFYPSGILGSVQVGWLNARKIRQMVVVSEKRTIEFDDTDSLDTVRVFEKGISTDKRTDSFGEFRYLLTTGDIVSPKIDMREPLKNQCLHFLECLETGTRPISDGTSGANVVRVLEACSESLAARGREVRV